MGSIFFYHTEWILIFMFIFVVTTLFVWFFFLCFCYFYLFFVISPLRRLTVLSASKRWNVVLIYVGKCDVFQSYQELSIIVWYNNGGSSVVNRKTSARADIIFFRFDNLRSQRMLISHITRCCYARMGFTSKL